MILNGNSISLKEKLVLILIFALLCFGVAASWTNVSWFNNVYAIEDGFIEWLTVLALLVTTIVAVRYLILLAGKRTWLFSFVLGGLALFCFFAAGEEISWGQRLLGIETPAFFKEKNAQQETNLHNLVVNGVKVNKLLFSQLFTLVAAIYLIVIPYLYRKKSGFKRFIDNAGVPIAQPYQIISLLLVGVLTLICSGRSSELMELGSCGVFLLIVLYPKNATAFR